MVGKMNYLIIFLFFLILAGLIVRVARAESRKGRFVAGAAALGWSGLMFVAAGTVESFNLNIWYSRSADDLLEATVGAIEAGKGDEAASELAAMRSRLQVLYEGRGNFKVLAEETTRRLRELAGAKGEVKGVTP